MRTNRFRHSLPLGRVREGLPLRTNVFRLSLPLGRAREGLEGWRAEGLGKGFPYRLRDLSVFFFGGGA